MTREDFSTCKIPYLEEFLASRGINRTGTKEMLVRNCFSAYELELEETITDLLQEQNEVMKNHLDKLVIGKISLPDPYSLVDEWCNAPSHLPDTLYNDDVNDMTSTLDIVLFEAIVVLSKGFQMQATTFVFACTKMVGKLSILVVAVLLDKFFVPSYYLFQ